MLGKLLKYEFRATGRVFLPMFGAVLIVSAISRLLGAISGRATMSGSTGAPYVIGIVISIMLMVAILIATFMLTIQRFSKNLLGDEGYLMFTLPARIDWLILSKAIVSVVWILAGTVVILISIAIMSMADLGLIFSQIGWFLGQVFTDGAGTVLASIQVIIISLIMLLTGVLTFYMCMSLAMLFNRRRGFIAVGFFVLYMILTQIIGTLCVAFLRTDMFSSIARWTMSLEVTNAFAVNTILLVYLVASILWGCVLYFVTRYMLKNRLNLE